MKYQSKDRTSIITKVAVPAEVQKDACNQDDIGQQTYAKFFEKDINTNQGNVWATVKKVQLKMW